MVKEERDNARPKVAENMQPQGCGEFVTFIAGEFASLSIAVNCSNDHAAEN